MDGLLVDGPRFRRLREQAGVHRREMATLLDCSPGHVRNVETARVTAEGSLEQRKKHQLSAPKVYRARRIFSAHLGREVALEEFTDPFTAPSEVAA